MTPEQFTYWLQGFVETVRRAPTPEEWKIINNHLQTVFIKITPHIVEPRTPGGDTDWHRFGERPHWMDNQIYC